MKEVMGSVPGTIFLEHGVNISLEIGKLSGFPNFSIFEIRYFELDLMGSNRPNTWSV